MNSRRPPMPMIAAALILALAAPGHAAAADAASTSWELSPYRIQLLIAVQPGASASRTLAGELAANLPARAATIVGGAWQLEAAVAPAALSHELIHALADATSTRLPAEALKKDKVIVLTVADTEAGARIQAREYDVTTDLWNGIVSREASQGEAIAGTCIEAMLAAFAPVARIDAIDKGTATIRLKAGAIPRRDRSLTVISSGAVLRPVLVALDEAGQPQLPAADKQAAQLIDWTYLTVTSGGSSVVTCRIDTALTGEAIPAYHPRRIRLAVGVSASDRPTMLSLVSSGAASEPLEGIEVVASEISAGSDAKPQLLGLTDIAGQIAVPPGPTSVRMLDLRQGSQPLARVPIVPGLASKVRISLTDQRSRLALETMLAEAEDSLVDLAARRQTLAARIKLARNSGEAGADALLPKLRALANIEAPQALIDRAEKAIQASEPATQAQLQARLNALKKTAQVLAAQSPTSLVEGSPPADTKPAEPKPTESKPTETKPTETKPTESKPAVSL